MRGTRGTSTAVALGCLLVALASLPALAAPINGIYQSVEFGGDVMDGRWSEGGVGGIEGNLGNTIHAMSFNGTALGTMWEIAGPAISSPPTIISQVTHFGHTDTTYETIYSGGEMILGASGPWNDPGDGDYVVDITSYGHVTTKTTSLATGFSTFLTEISLSGLYRDFPDYSVTFLVAIAAPQGKGAVAPALYPSLLPSSVPFGAWGVVQKITMESLPEPASLVLLGLGAMGVIRRRQR